MAKLLMIIQNRGSRIRYKKGITFLAVFTRAHDAMICPYATLLMRVQRECGVGECSENVRGYTKVQWERHRHELSKNPATMNSDPRRRRDTAHSM